MTDPIIEQALSLLEALRDKGGKNLNGNELYLAMDLERFIRNQEGALLGGGLNELFGTSRGNA